MRDRSRRILAATTAALSVLTLAGCSAQLGDRGGQQGSPVDKLGDVDFIEVWRNADQFPNVARVCVDGIGLATTSTGRGESGGATPLARVAEWDVFCSTKKATP